MRASRAIAEPTRRAAIRGNRHPVPFLVTLQMPQGSRIGLICRLATFVKVDGFAHCPPKTVTPSMDFPSSGVVNPRAE